MTKQEILKWIKEAKHVITDYCETDSDGNNYTRDIFERDGIYYSIEYINGRITSHIKVDKDGKAVKDGKFSPKKIEIGEVNFTRYSPEGIPIP